MVAVLLGERFVSLRGFLGFVGVCFRQLPIDVIIQLCHALQIADLPFHFAQLGFDFAFPLHFLVRVGLRWLRAFRVWNQMVTAIEAVYDVVVVSVLIGLSHDGWKRIDFITIDFPPHFEGLVFRFIADVNQLTLPRCATLRAIHVG